MPANLDEEPKRIRRPGLKMDKPLRDQLTAVARSRHHDYSDLIHRWLIDAWHVAQAGGRLPQWEKAPWGSKSKAGITQVWMPWTQSLDEYREIADALEAAGSSVRAVLEHCIAWYVKWDGDLLSAPSSPFAGSRGAKK